MSEENKEDVAPKENPFGRIVQQEDWENVVNALSATFEGVRENHETIASMVQTLNTFREASERLHTVAQTHALGLEHLWQKLEDIEKRLDEKDNPR